MPAPEMLARIEALAPGKRVTVVNAQGEAHALPLAAQTETAQKLAELDLQIRSTMGVVASIASGLNEIVARVEKVLSAVENAAQNVASDQAEVARSIARLNATLAQPVKPIYDAKGILIGARRVEKLETKQ
jgi:hypothetical protein